jgi:saccharopine dehydrogenase-like NADP-dependent oxidoreductase
MKTKHLKWWYNHTFRIEKVFSQTVNTGELSVLSNTQLSTVVDFDNKESGDFLNDGNFYVYSNFKNDGLFTYTDLSDGRIFFYRK